MSHENRTITRYFSILSIMFAFFGVLSIVTGASVQGGAARDISWLWHLIGVWLLVISTVYAVIKRSLVHLTACSLGSDAYRVIVIISRSCVWGNAMLIGILFFVMALITIDRIAESPSM
jgi:hypothetical protein